MFRASRRRWPAMAVLALALVFPSAVAANHSWGDYHWARTSNPFTLGLGDNVSSAWDSYLVTSSADWSVSTVLDTTIVAGSNAKPKNCRPKAGRVEVCSAAYGYNGWLGVAQIWASGSHITQGTVRVNDSYFKTATYNTPAWRNLVMCQEVGHTFGLGHQDETFGNTNLGTCMDYTNDPDGSIYGQLDNQHPNTHDYEQLVTIYTHLDATTTVGQVAAVGSPAAEPADWGRLVASLNGGRTSVFELEVGAGQRVVTFVIWA